MDRFSTALLEFPALKLLLERYVGSALGLAELDKVEPGLTREELVETLADAGEAVAYVRTGAQLQTAARGSSQPVRFTGLPDVTVAVQKLRIEGASLEGRELYDLTTFLDRADEIRQILATVADEFPRLAGRIARMGDFRGVLGELEGKILPDGSLADTASVALNRLRKEIERQKRAIQESLERFLRAHQEDGTLQEEFVTIRNERFVVPIVSGQKRRVDGVIHGASGTGRTLFVEPLETIGLNNDLVRLTDDEMREVHRILREMTERLRLLSPVITSTLEAMSELELLFAKAYFARDFDCTIPRISPDDQRRLVLREARHPLLQDVLRKQQKQVVPFSLEVDDQIHTFLISGPNTGGKTVTMKTVGLLALMAQAGLPVPAAEAEFPLFDQVLSDIGDQQSITESLSSFSSHIARVKEMEEAATFESLVLLDELGRATDPEEGGALGIAILEHFRMIGSLTFASTHLLAMKVWGANTRGVLNASVGFDEETLQPTYILRVGAPGKSAGLDIASRLGLPPQLIERARAALTTTQRDVAQFLNELHRKIEEAAEAEQALRNREAAFAIREEALERGFQKREAARQREIETMTAKVVAQFEKEARRTIDDIQKTADQRKAAEQAMRRVAKTKREFQQQVETEVIAGGRPANESGPKTLPLTEGVRVRLKGVRELAKVRRLLGDDRIEVEAGFLRMQVSRDDVTEVLPPAGETPASKLPKNVTLQTGPKWDVSYRELNLIGQRSQEAVDQVDKFLDDASLASVDRVRIIHGFGMGILRKAVTEHLQRHPHVEKFYPATPAEGGNGATIVELKAS